MTAELTSTILIVHPNAGRRRPRHVGPDDHLDRQWFTLDSDHHVRIRNAQDMVVSYVLRLFEPPGRNPIEHLALERQCTEHRIKGADAVSHNDGTLIVSGVVVAHLAFVLDAKLQKIRGYESVL